MRNAKRLTATALMVCILVSMLPSVVLAATTANGTSGNTDCGTVTVDPSLYPESSHTYANNLNESKTFTWPGAERLEITFSTSTEVENNYDKIYLYDGSGNQLAVYTGTTAAGVTVTIPGDTFTVQLITDGSGREYGYSFISIVAYMGAICEHSVAQYGVCADCGSPICCIITDNEGNEQLFTTVAETLAAAEAGQTIVMTSDVAASELCLPSGVTFDLNGYMLTVDSVLTYDSSAIIDSSEQDTGVLKITDTDGNMISTNNCQLPVYDSARGGYRFFNVRMTSQAVTGNNKYWFKVEAENFDELYKLIQANAKILFKAKMRWDGQSRDTYATADLAFTQSWADRYNANSDIYITVTVTESQGVENFTLTPCITSGGVEITGVEM